VGPAAPSLQPVGPGDAPRDVGRRLAIGFGFQRQRLTRDNAIQLFGLDI